ncbi:hypothetical protein FPV67DRAFT_1737506 [Lyophyllum atratum]|nr:hypothetical protein FPV67DRAFT_1737506 [Lyophyllum atratum]
MSPSTSRKTRSRTSGTRASVKTTPAKDSKTRSRKAKISKFFETADGDEDDANDANGEDEDYDEREAEADEEDDAKEYDSDALDDDDVVFETRKRKQRPSSTSPQKRTRTKSPTKKNTKRQRVKTPVDDGEEFEMDEGQEVVGAVVQAPSSGRVPPGQISQNTLNFLKKLKDPACNDREWTSIDACMCYVEPVYRQAEGEWKAFVEHFTDLLTDADPQVPPLPPKDVIHRIYRDMRFSNDKTPYKKSFSASFSRSGRKGIFAGLKLSVQPDGQTLIAAGSWCPGRAELANIRTNILNDSARLRRVLTAPAFVSYFGKPRPSADGSRQSVFGMEDELKVAPKGVDKSHKDIDLLKCRSFAVVHRFPDEEVLAADFSEKVTELVRIMRPFVHCLNDMMTVGAGGGSDGSGEDEEEEDGE